MVNLINCSFSEFQSKYIDEGIVCFGAGKYFDRYSREAFYIRPVLIIDNNAAGEKSVNGVNISICRLQDAIDTASKVKAILITSSYYIEILEQLDKIDELEGIDCLIPYPFFFENRELPVRKRSENKNVASDYVKAGNRFIIWERRYESFNAAQKAPYDVRRIVENEGWYAIEVHACPEEKDDSNWEKKRMYEDWQNVREKVKPGSIVLLQHPFVSYQKERRDTLRELKKSGVKFIALLHDLEEVRKYIFSEYMAGEERFILELTDILIVHNDVMKKVLLDKGISQDRLVSLGIFDYLSNSTDFFERSCTNDVIVAGNLDPVKNPHLSELGELEGLVFQLFGAGYDEKLKSDNIVYNGSFPAEELPDELSDGFGLVWAGDSLEGCSGDVGEYLRYNDPHKLSLYLAAGLPVIIWDEAAMADFVLENDVGFTVSSLYELESKLSDITEEIYNRYATNARRIGERLRAGEYTKAAIKEAEKRLGLDMSCSNDTTEI